MQLVVLVVCLFIPQLFGLTLSHYSIIFLLTGVYFYFYSISIDVLFLIILLYLSFDKKSLILLAISFLISISFNPYTHFLMRDLVSDGIKEMYDIAVNHQLICKDYNQVINTMGNPAGFKENNVLKNGKAFIEKELHYYPILFFWPTESLSIIIIDNTVATVAAKGRNRKEESVKKMREQQKLCNNLKEYFNQ